jgi:hypothetical protein
MNICAKCFKSDYIVNYLNRNRVLTNKVCAFCGNHQSFDLSNDQEVLEMISDNIRYHYSIYQYFDKHIPYFVPKLLRERDFLCEENPIFYQILSKESSKLLFNLLDAKTTLSNEYTFLFHKSEKEDKDTEWWYRLNYDEHYGLPLKESKAILVNQIEDDLQKMNHFKVFQKYLDIFGSFIDKIPRVNLINYTFFRARKGNNNKEVSVNGYSRWISFPYIDDEICAPPPLLTSGGRFNRVGCSFLYIASNEITAVSEVKPEAGENCTIASFKCISDADFLDVRTESIMKIPIEVDLEFVNKLESLNRLFSLPILSHENYKYLITQFLSDLFREMDFAGVVYDSPQGDGYNVTAFDPSMFKLNKYSEKIVKVSKIQYSVIDVEDERYKYKDIEFIKESDNKKYLENYED